MTQARLARSAAQKGVAWLLLIAIAFMGLTITRQHALGSMHRHVDPNSRATSAFGSAVSSFASDWLSRWQQQKVFGHSQLRPMQLCSAPAHTHDVLERHHHAANDASVVALDGAAELAGAADSSGGGASALLIGIGAPSAGLVLQVIAGQIRPWPKGLWVHYISRNVPPLLRPPAV